MIERKIYIIFDGPPAQPAGRFVEVENEHGVSIRAGEWRKRDDDMWALEIVFPDICDHGHDQPGHICQACEIERLKDMALGFKKLRDDAQLEAETAKEKLRQAESTLSGVREQRDRAKKEIDEVRRQREEALAEAKRLGDGLAETQAFLENERTAADDALDAIAKICDCEDEYPDQVVGNVKAIVKERDSSKQAAKEHAQANERVVKALAEAQQTIDGLRSELEETCKAYHEQIKILGTIRNAIDGRE